MCWLMIIKGATLDGSQVIQHADMLVHHVRKLDPSASHQRKRGPSLQKGPTRAITLDLHAGSRPGRRWSKRVQCVASYWSWWPGEQPESKWSSPCPNSTQMTSFAPELRRRRLGHHCRVQTKEAAAAQGRGQLPWRCKGRVRSSDRRHKSACRGCGKDCAAGSQRLRAGERSSLQQDHTRRLRQRTA